MLPPMRVATLVVLTLLLAPVLPAATVTGFDGRSIAVERLPALDDLDCVVLGGATRPSVSGSRGVLLVDGSWLPAESIAAGAGADRVLVRGPLGAVELPLEAVAGWGDPLPAAPANGDAVLVASGLLNGRIQGLRDGALSFHSAIDPEPLSLPLGDILAARLGNPARSIDGLRLRAVIDPSKPGLDLLVKAERLVLAAAPSVALAPEAFGDLVLRVEGGRRVYLSDLTPAAVRDEGMFGVVWPYARNRSLDGTPLRLGGVLRAKGLVVHSVASLRWDLAAAYARLRAEVGISDLVAPEGDCLAELRGDGRSLWQARVRGGEPVRRIDLDLSGVKSLELIVAAGERFDIGDHLTLADAQLIRK